MTADRKSDYCENATVFVDYLQIQLKRSLYITVKFKINVCYTVANIVFIVSEITEYISIVPLVKKGTK